jgi:hypothetical protein
MDGVYTDGYYCDANGNPGRTLSSRRRGPFVGRLFEQMILASDVFGPPGCVVLRRKVVLDNDLWFDEDLYYCNDWDFFTRYADVATIGHISDRTYNYRVYPSSITNRLGLTRRAHYIAKCRAKAVKLPSFRACSTETRYAAFYDLLVNQLRGSPARQSEVCGWQEFIELSAKNRARLLRLMASKALMFDGDHARIGDWLALARRLDPFDLRVVSLSFLHRLSPTVCRRLLLVKNRAEIDPLTVPPFADLNRAAVQQ